MRKTLSLLLIASLTAAAAACVPDDPEETENRVNQNQEDCPAERAYRCADDSCAAEAESCPGEEPDYPEALAGEVLSMSPATVRGDEAQPVTIELRIDDAEALQKLLDDGAKFQISVKDSTGEELHHWDELIDETVEATQAEGDEGLVTLVFTPSQEDRVRIRKQVEVQLSVDNGDGKLYAWGKRFLAFPDDIDNIGFDGRRVSDLEGITDLQRVWSDDLDGDGRQDLLILDEDEEASRLLVFRCGADKCEPVGEVALAPEADQQIIAPDMISAGSDEASGEFAIAFPSLYGTADGDLREVDHLTIRLVEDGDTFAVEEERATIALPIRDGRTWHEDTLRPRLIEDDSGNLTAGISLIALQQSSGTMYWEHSLLQHASEPYSQSLNVEFDGLEQAGQDAALMGQISVCPSDSSLRQGAMALPEGRLVSVFEADGTAMVAVSSSTSGQLIKPRVLPENIAAQMGEGASAKCELVDLDGDGRRDVAFSVTTDEGQALLMALADASSDSVVVGEPELLIDGLSDDSWEFHGDGEDLRLVLTRGQANPPPGEMPEITHEIGLEINVDDTDNTISVGVTNEAPAATDKRVDSSTTIVHTDAGYRLMSADKCGEDGVCSADVGGIFLGSEHLRSSGGQWIAAHFSGGIVEGDESALLQQEDPKSIIGWLSTTGPFLPLSTVSCCYDGKASPLIIQELAMAGGDDEDSDDDGVEAHLVELIVDEHGDATGLRLQDLAIVDGEPRVAGEREIELDFSSTELATSNVVKFKAGAELSKTAAVMDSSDCDDQDTDSRPGRDGVCSTASSASLVFIMDSGELATAEIFGDTEQAQVSQVETSHEQTEGSVFFDSLGGAPVLATRFPPILAPDVWESTSELSLGQGEDRQTLTRADSRILFGDFSGLGHPQILELTQADGDAEVCGTTNHLAMAGGEGQGDLDSIEAALDREGQSVCIPSEERISITDIDGDRCQDLVFPDSGRALLSRCDGSFEPELAELREGSAHLAGDDGWVNKAQDYNSSRSNKTRSIRDIFDEDTDGDGIDDEVMVVLPYIDGLQRLR